MVSVILLFCNAVPLVKFVRSRVDVIYLSVACFEVITSTIPWTNSEKRLRLSFKFAGSLLSFEPYRPIFRVRFRRRTAAPARCAVACPGHKHASSRDGDVRMWLIGAVMTDRIPEVLGQNPVLTATLSATYRPGTEPGPL
jgi:hypothetical protein